ncbi:MAG: endonuclease V [Candidatus Thorarchaeota archaeon]|nr:MAG: endonuclease V [Candidatus Thorarchaeota archaeon]
MFASGELAHTLAETAAQQERLAKEVIMYDDPPFDGTLVTGVDVAYSRSEAVGCAVVVDLLGRQRVRIEKATRPCTAPYVPGFFQLREGPVVEEVLKSIDCDGPILINGNGVLHPRRLGLASYVGVKMDKQTIGVAKGLLVGQIGPRCGDVAYISDSGVTVGSALWLGNRKRPIFVSVGHRTALETALSVVRASSISGFPEPLLMAHRIAKSLAQDLE